MYIFYFIYIIKIINAKNHFFYMKNCLFGFFILVTSSVFDVKNYFNYLEQAGLIKYLGKTADRLRQINSPEKIYLDNPNQMFAISPVVNKGTIRETFFLDMLTQTHHVSLSLQGDFLVDNQFLFEIGGRNKKDEQIKSSTNAYTANDDIEIGINKKIPLWLFGLIY